MFITYSQGESQLSCEILVTDTLFKLETEFVMKNISFMKEYSSKDWEIRIFNFK